MEDLRPLSYIIISLLYILAMITIVMRIWVRGYSMKSFGWDDWAMASLLVSTNLHSYLRLTDAIRSNNFRSSFLSNKAFCIFFWNLVPGCKWHRRISRLCFEISSWSNEIYGETLRILIHRHITQVMQDHPEWMTILLKVDTSLCDKI